MEYFPLTQGYSAVVNEEDIQTLKNYTWHVTVYKRGQVEYLRASTSLPRGPYCRTVFMHHVIMGQPINGRMIDHINGNGLDNRRSNLRIVTRAQNTMNSKKPIDSTSKYKGVCWNSDSKKWQSQIRKDNKLTYLGLYDDEIMAAKKYNEIAKEKFGEYARLNEV